MDAGISAPLGPRWFRQAGGMPPTHFAPRAKMPSGRYLCFREREEIALELAKGVGIRAIARKLGRSPSTVSREVRRNAATRSGGLDYRASAAQWHADRAALRPRPGKLAGNPALHAYVIERLAGKISDAEGATFDGPSVVWKERRAVHRQSRRWSTAWSPEQIAHRLRLDYPEDRSMRISHEAIYQCLYIQGRGELRRELARALRTGRTVRKPRRTGETRQPRFTEPMVMISERPAEVEDRAVPGHWEGDLIIGGGGTSAIGTLVERATRFVLLVHLPGRHDAETVRDALITTIDTLPELLKQSLTWDQGSEMGRHREFSLATGMPVYFCDPHSPWQRGSNENTNGLLRQYFPKGSDLSVHTAEDLAAVAAQLNRRPRKTLGWDTPAERLTMLLAEAS